MPDPSSEAIALVYCKASYLQRRVASSSFADLLGCRLGTRSGDGATVAAFATSSPELTVAVTAAADGRPELALGDALGNNVVNIGLVVGVVLVHGVTSTADIPRRDTGTALGMALLLLVLLLDGMISRLDGISLLGVFGVWLAVTTIDA